jgi:hypothetical protein
VTCSRHDIAEENAQLALLQSLKKMLNWRYYNHRRKCSIGVTTITEENAQLALLQY